MHNYKLRIQYDGTNFFGWQSQPDGNTVQDEITNAIKTILRENINLIGSGRTDAGVHALGQVANFRTNSSIDRFKFRHSLNSILPESISVISIEPVNEEFHSRFDAKKRVYFYLFTKGKSPFYYKYSFYSTMNSEREIKRLNLISENLLGKHDFTSFARRKTETENKICTIKKIRWSENNKFIIFRIEADRFLHGMVRTIVGTVLDLEKKKNSTEEILNILDQRNRDTAGQSMPAKGLFLYKVGY
ncbi:tRNA pseudouridine synthase A [bacterium BMS3Abin04]|nr:tRNA pseudouridine synthase A [bacterium BMS3Abin04]